MTDFDHLDLLSRRKMPWRCRIGFHETELPTGDDMERLGFVDIHTPAVPSGMVRIREMAALPLFFCTRCGRWAMFARRPWEPFDRALPNARTKLDGILAARRSRP